jgi:hypothetical protein
MMLVRPKQVERLVNCQLGDSSNDQVKAVAQHQALCVTTAGCTRLGLYCSIGRSGQQQEFKEAAAVHDNCCR